MSERELSQLRHDADRYRRAAADALEQLDWCIGYFHGAGKPGIAAALSRNRTTIRERLLHRDPQPTPSHPSATQDG
jgi:hypothetical protein